MADEPNNGIAMASAADFRYTLDEEQVVIARAAHADDRLFLVAELEGQIVGVATCNAGERGYLHTCTLGVTVRRELRHQGIGMALMQAMIDWARSSPEVHRLELWVFADNLPAIALYEKLGFEHEGRQRAAFWKEGEFKDLLLMGMLFES